MHTPSERKGGDGSEPKGDQINENLKRVYDATLNEPLPDKLVDLLERLKKEGSK